MQSSINLDETDVKILCAVMNDVWAPASEIAKEVGVSRPQLEGDYRNCLILKLYVVLLLFLFYFNLMLLFRLLLLSV